MKIFIYIIILAVCMNITYEVQADSASYHPPLVSPPDAYNPWYTKPEFNTDNLTDVLLQHFRTMRGFGSNAEEAYQESLNDLRNQSRIPEFIYEVYRSLDTSDYSSRWNMALTLQQLNQQATLNALIEIASEPMPLRAVIDNHHYSTQMPESMIRSIAVDGISQSAIDGHGEAQEVLLGFVNHDDLSVRRRAIRGYLKTGDYHEKEKELKEIVADESHWLITLDVTDINSLEMPRLPSSIPDFSVKEDVPIVNPVEGR